ncbi:MAG TPA: hypothetical protein VMR34_05385 [Candidatus Saccharimonadales bacterium]|jgi:hypothetical protein|nr:hypothetical protein [Candidatus Saccharimonadales bacterium]
MSLVRSKPSRSVEVDEKSFKTKRKEDALELAQILYDIFKEKQANDKLKNGQNNAQQITNS